MDVHGNIGYAFTPSHYGHTSAPGIVFNHKVEKIDWRRIAAVDINRITKDLDFSSLQDTISSIAFCDIEHELESKYTDPNFIRLFRLAQLQIQYLLYSQDYLTGAITSEAERNQVAIDELDKLRRELASIRERQVDLKKQCHRYKKMVRIQQMLMPSSHDLHHPCPHCDKKFISRDFLGNHIERRHRGQQFPQAVPVNISSGSGTKEMDELRTELHRKSTEIALLREQMLQGGNIDVVHLRDDLMQQHKSEIDNLKGMFMEEMKELNSRYLASEKALQELRVKQNQGSRSNLGELEDDDENAIRLQNEQREKERILEENRKLKADIAREKAIKKASEKRNLERERAEFEKKREMEARSRSHLDNGGFDVVPFKMSSLDSITPSVSDESILVAGKAEVPTRIDKPSPERNVEVESKDHAKRRRRLAKENEVVRTKALEAAGGRGSDNKRPLQPHPPVQPHHAQTVPMKMNPEVSDDEESEEESESALVSKEMKKTLADTGMMGTGELSATSSWDISQLRSSRVMEKLKAEPSLLQNFITELRDILEERLMELGVDRKAMRISTPVLNEKLGILRKEREQMARKHVRYAAIRQQYIREVEKEAQEKLRLMMGRGRNPPPSGGQRRPGNPRPPPRQSPQMERRSATLPSRITNGVEPRDGFKRNQPSAPPLAPSGSAGELVPRLQSKYLDDESSETDSDESYSAIGDHRQDPISIQGHGDGPRPSPPPHSSNTDSDVRPSPRKPRQHRPLSATNGLNKMDSPDSQPEWDTIDGKKLIPQSPQTQMRGRPNSAIVTIPSHPSKREESESDDDWDASVDDDLEQLENDILGNTGGGNVARLTQSLEMQFKQPRNTKAPAGAINLLPAGDHGRLDRDIDADNFDDDDAFDVSSLNGEDSRPPSRKVSLGGMERGLFGGNGARASVGSSGGAGAQTTSPSGQLRLSAAGTDLSNTFGTSQWGTTSKGERHLIAELMKFRSVKILQ